MTGRETRKLPALLRRRSRAGLNAHGQAGQSHGPGGAGPATALSKHKPSTETTLAPAINPVRGELRV